MQRRGSSGLARLAIATVVLALSAVAVAAAAVTAPLVLPIPGFSGRQLRVAEVARLSDGGGLVAASVQPAGSSSWTPVAVRLLLDGSVDLAYGSEGIAALHVGAGGSASALAIDPNSGRAWIGLSGPGGRGAIVALGPNGGRVPGFGHGGVVSLGPGHAPVALAWRSQELLVAYGTTPCRGCELTALNPATGATLASGAASPAAPPPATACPRGSVSSAVMVGHASSQLAFGGAGCAAQLIDVAIATAQHAITTTATTPLGPAGATASEAQYGTVDCAATGTARAIRLGPVPAGASPFAPSIAPGGRLLALVALGQGACAGLIAGHGGATVVQTSPQQPRPTSDRVPGSITPLGMFRCHAHLLVIGARRRAGGYAGEVVVVPVRRGPSVQSGFAAPMAVAAGPGSQRCT